MRTRTALLALACAAALAIPAAYAQGADAATGSPEGALPLPEPAYDTFFVPFTDNPLYRLQDPAPFTVPEPLFAPFNALDGLDLRAKVSRVATPGRAIASFPVLSARKGERITVPLTLSGVSLITAYTLRFHYDPAILRATDVQKAGWTDSSLDFNVRPDNKTTQNRVFVVQYSGEPWTPDKPPVSVTFDVIGTGTSDLTVEAVDVADDTFNNVPLVAHDGLVKVSG